MSEFIPSFTPNDFTDDDLLAFFTKYIHKKHLSEIIEIMRDENSNVSQYGLRIALDSITNESMAIGTMILHYPQKLISICNRAIVKIQQNLLDQGDESTSTLNERRSGQSMTNNDFGDGEGRSLYNRKAPTLKQKIINARLENVPLLPEFFKMAVSDLRNYNISRLVILQGTVVRTSTPTVVEYEKKYKCTQCQGEFSMFAQIDADMAIDPPTRCGAASVENPCKGKKFSEILGGRCIDLQEIKVQDKVTHLQVGRIPRSMTCQIEDDLVDSCKPGDDVEVTGYLLRHWKNFKSDELMCFDTIFHAINIRVINQNKVSGDLSDEKGRKKIRDHWEKYQNEPLRGRDIILKSVCPRLYGMWRVKLSLLLVLIGGVSKVKGETRVRGESHILLVGDPGTGKSQLLKFAVSVAKRNVFTSGTGTSSAGLTVMATKDSAGAWVLEAGALVLADGGVCCIDEFSGISEYDRATIHEAMEQQTLSVAKAGLVCKLNTRCTIVAACNPKAKFDRTASLTANTTLASPLLSRFDIIIVLPDIQDEKWDKQIADYILNEREMEEEEDGERWSFQDLKSYICHVKQIQPTLSSDAVEILKAYYKYQRANSSDQSQITVRFLESLIRISQAHARLMHRKEVTEQDAIMAIIAIDTSKSSLLEETSRVLHENFPDNPDEWYEHQREIVLQKLGLSMGMEFGDFRGFHNGSKFENRGRSLYGNVIDNDNERERFHGNYQGSHRNDTIGKSSIPDDFKHNSQIQKQNLDTDREGGHSVQKAKKFTLPTLDSDEEEAHQNEFILREQDNRFSSFKQRSNGWRPPISTTGPSSPNGHSTNNAHWQQRNIPDSIENNEMSSLNMEEIEEEIDGLISDLIS